MVAYIYYSFYELLQVCSIRNITYASECYLDRDHCLCVTQQPGCQSVTQGIIILCGGPYLLYTMDNCRYAAPETSPMPVNAVLTEIIACVSTSHLDVSQPHRVLLSYVVAYIYHRLYEKLQVCSTRNITYASECYLDRDHCLCVTQQPGCQSATQGIIILCGGLYLL